MLNFDTYKLFMGELLMKVAIMTDENSGISPEVAKEKGIFLMPMPCHGPVELYFGQRI